MKAIIMAAGVGNRIKELTNGKPKSFLEIEGKSIIQHQIDTLKSFGVKDITIVVGYQKELFKQFLEQGVNLIYNPFYKSTNVLGSFWFTKKIINEPFLFMHADTYFEPEIVSRLLDSEGNNFAVEFKECGEEEMKVVVENGLINNISKELQDSHGEFIGVAKIENFNEVKKVVKEIVHEHHGTFFEKIIQELIPSGINFNAVNINNLVWEEVDFKEDYYSLIQKIEEKKGKQE
jgi:L-glutamine-phosphate cytidylyltransferase